MGSDRRKLRRRRAVIAGLATAGRFAARSYGPSLMRRSPIDQGLVTGGAMVGGFVMGAVASTCLEILPKPVAGAALKLGGLGAAGSRAAETLGQGSSGETVSSTTAEGWADAGVDILAGVGIARLVTSDGPTIAKLAAAGGVLASIAADTNDNLRDRPEEIDGSYMATSFGVALGASSALAMTTTAVRLGGVAARSLGNARVARATMSVTGSAAMVGLGAIGMRIALGKVLSRIADGNRATEVAFSTPPTSAHTSGGPESVVDFSTLGLQGRRFVLSTSTPAAIKDVTGKDAATAPVRVYVGVDSRPDIDTRVEAAIEDLDRLGGFDRSVIVAACPAGTGYVNYIPVEATEYMTRGDCATVAIQYGALPSMLSLNRLGYASDTYGALLRRLRAEIAARGLDTTLIGYGESLGALAGQAGTLAAADGDQLPVDRALWVGTPKGSRLFETETAAGVPVLDSPVDLDATDHPILFLNHHNDPVTVTAAEDLYRMPTWLGPADRGRGTNPAQRWFPVVSFFQGLIDTKNAATVVPGEFMSTGHDYRADLAAFVRSAFGFGHVSDEELASIDTALRSSEVSRSQAIALGTAQSA